MQIGQMLQLNIFTTSDHDPVLRLTKILHNICFFLYYILNSVLLYNGFISLMHCIQWETLKCSCFGVFYSYEWLRTALFEALKSHGGSQWHSYIVSPKPHTSCVLFLTVNSVHGLSSFISRTCCLYHTLMKAFSAKIQHKCET